MVVPVDKPGADCGESVSLSSRNGLVDRGRSGRALAADALEGDKARFRKGLLDPKLAAVGEIWSVKGRFESGIRQSKRQLLRITRIGGGRSLKIPETSTQRDTGKAEQYSAQQQSGQRLLKAQHYAPVGGSDTPGGYPSAGGAFMVK